MENPGTQVETAVEQCLELAATWLAWDGSPCVSEDGERIYTPHKAVRRIGDHLIDHLAEVEALLAGVETMPDQWHASLVDLRLATGRGSPSRTWSRPSSGCGGSAGPSR